MPQEILALIDKPWLLGLLLGIGGVIGIMVERFVETQNRARRRAYWQTRNGVNKARWSLHRSHDRPQDDKSSQGHSAESSTEQLACVMAADFTSRSLLNKSEARVFRELDKMVIARNRDWQVMAQVSMGEFVASQSPTAYGCVNSKRVDLLLVDGECRARHAIEYQGAGHHQGSAAARDAVKKEALRKAGIGYHEVVAGQTTPSDLKRLVEKLVDERTQISG